MEKKKKRKPAGVGRPMSTETTTIQPVRYRVSVRQWGELEEEARRLHLPSGHIAAKRRAFPED